MFQYAQNMDVYKSDKDLINIYLISRAAFFSQVKKKIIGSLFVSNSQILVLVTSMLTIADGPLCFYKGKAISLNLTSIIRACCFQ